MSKKLNFKKAVIKLLKEGDDTFFYLAPDIIGSVNNSNLDLGKNTFKINFATTDGRTMTLAVPAKTYQGWDGENEGADVKDFLMAFVKCSNPVEDEEMLDEIIDEYGELIGDDEEPENANFRDVGKSKFDTEKVIKQTVPKSKRYYGDLGLGVVMWTWALLLGINLFLFL
jgi:hypothetical protein